MLDFGFYNMDCLEGMKQFPDKYFDLAIVDPVYGGVTKGGYMTHNKGQWLGGKSKAREKGYHDAVWKQEKTGPEYFEELFRVSKNQIVWGGNYFTNCLPESQCWVVWDKEKPDGITFADVELAWTSFNEAAKIFRYKWNGFMQGDMKNKEFRINPCQKPVRLYEKLLWWFAKSGDKILDTHVGSASSLVACQKMGYQYVGFEIDETYYNDAKKRLDDESAQLNMWQFGINPYQE